MTTVHSQSDHWFDQLLAYVSHFDVGFEGRIRGAEKGEIKELERLVGHKLPTSYGDYLLEMGHDHGGLLELMLADLGIWRPREFYRGLRGRPRPGNPDLLLIGTGIAGAYEEVSLQPVEAKSEPRVVETDEDGEVLGMISESLPKLLFQQGFKRYEVGSYEFVCDYSLIRGRHTLEAATSCARDLAFKELWCSDDVSYCGRTRHAVLAMSQPPDSTGWIRLAGSDEEVVYDYGERLKKTLGVEEQISSGRKWG